MCNLVHGVEETNFKILPGSSECSISESDGRVPDTLGGPR